MNEITEFFAGLFSTKDWPARWNCGYWSNFHGWLYIISDLLIWTAYFLIPLIILNYLNKKKATLKFNKAYVYFAAFILLCGSTHFIDALMFWVPMYRINAVVRVVTAAVSLITVYYLTRILPEAFRQKTNVELETEIKRREEAEQKLEEANKSLEAFVYIASHDLQEPLRKIRIFTDRLFDASPEKFNDDDRALYTKITGSSQRMQGMIRDVLSLSTLSSDVTLSGRVNTQRAVDSALADLEIKILEKAAVINVGVLPQVMGNEAYLSQLFLNLLGNSLKFTTQQPVISIEAEQQNGRVLIHVADNGIGMHEDKLPVIFKAFQRLNSKSQYEGSGIGLAICKKIVEVHHGSISVKSKPGEGTVFTVDLCAANLVSANGLS